ncbi:S-adenosyl-L-methionine-dependent methyltransferase [Hypoxylon rubiginosum]|uniref:S-adenosyl-L-methionine-dependent methyltransferase n=1 Tax=Hypoxylon rubiginosum TaxID=110542 RepID=A0ACC0CUZ0_9PEZI|nr:S-adenosyl-L-methionine-dependent methyltransferase [Hypoxylon rubiginosum]
MSQDTHSNQNQGSEPVASEGHKVNWSTLPEDVFRVFETRTAHNSAVYLLPTLQEIQSRNPQMKLLDVGSGSGSISASFAKIIGPAGGHVTAVDVNPVVLERATKILSDKYGVPADRDWISFEIADGHKLPFEDDTFDVVHCHQVLAHNKGQWEILREMLRVAKPGGVVAAREGDMETEVFWPPLPGLLKFHNDLEVRVIRARGASTSSGRELLSWALKANGGNRSKIVTSFSAWSYTEPEDRKLWAQGMIEVALSNPIVCESNIKSGITEAEMDEMRDAWIEWRDRDDATLSMVQGEILMRK